MTRSTQLLVIDPQNDFCDVPVAWHPTCPLTGERIAPRLPVTGAHADMQRTAALIEHLGARLDAITLTLDSHQCYDIAHPDFWQHGDGRAVSPFTSITAQQVRAGEFAPRLASAQPRVLAYLDALQAQGRYTLMVWPVHCELGTWGHGIHASVQAACHQWQAQQQRAVEHAIKGTNPWTEHYSALQAEVPDASDPDTQLNTRLLAQLDAAQVLYIAGEASSHCVRSTVEHLVAHLPRVQRSGRADHLVLLTNCMSPVAGFEAQAHAFFEAMQARGVRLQTVHSDGSFA